MAQPAKHTPGPWTVEQCSAPVYGSDGSIIAEGIGIGTQSTHIGTVYGKNNAHNANLIAAAPAMYLELKESLVLLRASYHDMCEKHGADSLHAQVLFERIESVCAALAQAEGKQ